MSTPPVSALVRVDRWFRRVIFWSHLATALVVGVIVLIMSVTGVLLAYERPLLDRMARRHVIVPPSPTAVRVSLDTLVARGQAASGGRRASGLTMNADPAVPVLVGLDNRRTTFLDPFTGAVLGDDRTLRDFFTVVERWHRSVGLGDAARSALGTKITGASNLAFFFLVVSGLYLWWPRRWTGHALRQVAMLNTRARGKARDWNWHHVVGFWSLPVLALVVGSAVLISYQWPMAIMNAMTGARPVVAAGGDARGRRPGGRADVGGGVGQRMTASLDTVWARVSPRVRSWQTAALRLPRDGAAPMTITFSGRAGGGRPDQRLTLSVNARSGQITDWQSYDKTEASRRFRSWVRPVHTGEVGGLFGQTLAALVSAGAVLLVWIGFALAWRRLRAWQGRRSRVSERSAERSGVLQFPAA